MMTRQIVSHEKLPEWPKLIDSTDLRPYELTTMHKVKEAESLAVGEFDLWREADGIATMAFKGREVALTYGLSESLVLTLSRFTTTL